MRLCASHCCQSSISRRSSALARDEDLLAQAGEQALLILLGIFQRAEQAELVVLAQHLVEQHRRTLVGADVAVIVAGQAVEEAEHPHGLIVAAAHVLAEADVLIRIALQIGHVDVVEHVGPQGVDHHHQQVLVIARGAHAEGAADRAARCSALPWFSAFFSYCSRSSQPCMARKLPGGHRVGERKLARCMVMG